MFVVLAEDFPGLADEGLGGAFVDRDAPRLQGFGQFAHQIDGQQSIVQIGARNLDVISQIESPRERACRNAPVQEFTTAFAIGTLLVSMKRHGKAQGANLVMYALLLCVAFVMPTSDVPATSRLSILIRSSQKVCLNWAIGFVLAGISLDLVN